MCTTDQVACESWKFESMASEDSSIVKIKKLMNRRGRMKKNYTKFIQKLKLLDMTMLGIS